MTPPQHMEALDKANRIRLEAARFRREVAALPRVEGQERLAHELENGIDDSPVGTLPVPRFLMSANRRGQAAANRIVHEAHLARQVTGLRVRDLTVGERYRIAAALRRRT